MMTVLIHQAMRLMAERFHPGIQVMNTVQERLRIWMRSITYTRWTHWMFYWKFSAAESQGENSSGWYDYISDSISIHYQQQTDFPVQNYR